MLHLPHDINRQAEVKIILHSHFKINKDVVSYVFKTLHFPLESISERR